MSGAHLQPFGERAVDGHLPVWKRNVEAVEFDHTVGAMADKARTAARVESALAQALPWCRQGRGPRWSLARTDLALWPQPRTEHPTLGAAATT